MSANLEKAQQRIRECVARVRAGHGDHADKIVASLRGYQLRALAMVAEALDRGGYHLLLEGAMGTGKSRILIAIARVFDGFIITPSITIIRGMLRDLGLDCSTWSEDKIGREAYAMRISTPQRLHNRLASGEDPICDDPPRLLAIDEAHGHIDGNAVAGSLRAMLPSALMVGLTATAYRGSAASTKAFADQWGEPRTIISMAEAIDKGYILSPRFELAPLVDTSAIAIKNGDFEIGAVSAAYESVIGKLANLAINASEAGRPTVVSVPSSAVAGLLEREINGRTMFSATGPRPAKAILQGTPGRERGKAFKALAANELIVIQIRCLSVGMDIRELACIVDAQPTTSPVLWLQTMGRCMRRDPNNPEKSPLVICTNGNIVQHGYLFRGCPVYRDVMEAVAKEPKKDARQFLRRLVAASDADIGRVAVLKAPMLDGREVMFLNLAAPTSEGSSEFHEHLIARMPDGRLKHAERLTGAGTDWTAPEAQWVETPMPRVLNGLKTQKKRGGSTITEKQLRYWKACARSVGLDPHTDPEKLDSRCVGIMSAARSLGWKFR